jgi:hypothetical protein
MLQFGHLDRCSKSGIFSQNFPTLCALCRPFQMKALTVLVRSLFRSEFQISLSIGRLLLRSLTAHLTTSCIYQTESGLRVLLLCVFGLEVQSDPSHPPEVVVLPLLLIYQPLHCLVLHCVLFYPLEGCWSCSVSDPGSDCFDQILISYSNPSSIFPLWEFLVTPSRRYFESVLISRGMLGVLNYL